MAATFKCKICNRIIRGTLCQFQAHYRSKTHIENIPTFVTVKAPFTIDNIDSIHQYFSRFGIITSYTVRDEGDSVSIDYFFENYNSYSVIIQKVHWLFNQKLTISWIQNYSQNLASHAESTAMVNQYRRGSTNSQIPNQPTKLSLFKEAKLTDVYTEESRWTVINSVKRGKTFAQQVAILQSNLQTTNEAEMEKNRKLIQTHLRLTLAPTLPHHQIHFFGPSITGLDMRGNNFDIYVDNVRHRGKGELFIINAIRNLLCKSKEFRDVVVLSEDKDPVIRCIHNKTQICCDLNIWDKLPVQTSKLIKYYLTLDEKVFPLMIIIKFWAETYELTDVFSGYVLYLMVIFYLQQEPYKLPSVVDLQKDCPANIEDEWNCAFSTPANKYPVLRDESLLNLIGGFFRFYGNFDYVTQVISPYLGITVRKVAFIKPVDLPEAYHQYKGQNKLFQINSGISIQDPFEHSRNLSALIPLTYAGLFAVLCKIAEQYATLGKTDLLHTLLTKCWGPSLYEVRFDVEKSNTERTDQEWFDFVKTFTTRVCKEVLNCTVTQMFNSIDTQVIQCISQNNIWDNRIDVMKTIEKKLPPDINDFDREIAVVQNVMKYFSGRLFTKFEVTVVRVRSYPSRIGYTLHCKTRTPNIFFHVAHYLRIKLPTWLKIVEVCEKQTVREDVPNAVENRKPVETAHNGENIEMVKTVDKISDDNNVCRDVSPCKQVETSTDNELHLTDTEAQDNEEVPVEGAHEEAKHTEEDEIADKDAEEEEEDVPPGFFDIFSNQDFIDGLDIIDAFDEDSDKLVEEDKQRKKTHSPIRFLPEESNLESTEKRKLYKSKSRSPVRRLKRPRSRSRSRDMDSSDIRRDPEKTKRDIHKDKIKCMEDKEQKLVTDKLEIVDVALKPLKTEMEEDSATVEEKRRSAGDGVERVKSDREKRHSRRSGSREPLRKAPRHSRSPVYTGNRVESGYRRRRASSVDSNASERESRIRSRRKRSRSRSRDSPSRLKPRKYDDKPKRKTFLEEITDKLNEVHPVPVVQYNHPNLAYTNPVPPPHSIPAQVPAPSQFVPQPTMQHPQYDQRFFMGNANPIVQTQVFNNPLGHAAGNMVSVPQVQMNLMPQVPIVPKLPVVQQNTNSFPNLTERNETSVKPTEWNNNQTTDDMDKLFAEKKISLSDFLTITSKCEVQSASPEYLQKKIKVISRCQDAIKAMSEDRKFTGELSVKSSEAKRKSELKCQSPLRRIPIVRFQFTTPSKSSEEVDTFAVALDEILQKIGLLEETIDLEEVADVSSKNVGSSFADEDTTAVTRTVSLLNSKTISDVARCEECKKPKVRTFVDVGSQCADGKESVSIGTQVSEEELTPTKCLLKTESTACLTPAPLLGKDKEKEKKVVEVPTTPAVVSEKVEKKKTEAPKPLMNVKVKAPIRGRGGYHKQLRYRQFNNYGFEEEFECFNRPSYEFEDLRESCGYRYGGRGTPPVRYPRHFMDNGQPGLPRMNQLREEQGNMFTDFNQSFRGRNPNRFGPRY